MPTYSDVVVLYIYIYIYIYIYSDVVVLDTCSDVLVLDTHNDVVVPKCKIHIFNIISSKNSVHSVAYKL